MHGATKLVDIKPKLSNGKSANSYQVELLIKSDALKTISGMVLSEDINTRSMVSSRTSATFKFTGTECNKFCHTYILQIQKGSSSSCANGHQAALTYLVKIEGTRNLFMIQEAKEIWEFSLFNQITYTAEYLLGTLNTRRERSSRETKNLSSEWILNKLILQRLIQALGPVAVDLLASTLCYQIPKYIRWQLDSKA